MNTHRQKADCGLPCSFEDNGDLLRQALLQFPRRYQEDFTKHAKVDLRRLLFFAASYKGTYMKHFFDDVDEHTLPKAWQHVLMPERYQHLETEDFYFQRAHIDDPSHPNRACGRKFRKGVPVYRCATCSEDDTAGLCQDCFNEDQHSGHDITVAICQRENGGVCDCGDHEAWKGPLNCIYQDKDELPTAEVPEMFRKSLLQTFQVVLDYIIDVMSCSFATLPKETKQDNESILTDCHRSTLDQTKYSGTDWPSQKFHLMLYNDQNRQYRDAVQRITETTEKSEDFALMVADQVNLNGRAKVMTSTHIAELLTAQSTLESTGLPSCIRNARDTFREEMCGEMISWMLEMMNGQIYGNYNIARDIATEAFCQKWENGVKEYPHVDAPAPGGLLNSMIPTIAYRETQTPSSYWVIENKKWQLSPELLSRTGYNPNFAEDTSRGVPFHGSRFQYLLYFDIRLWKSIRTNVHTLFNTVLTTNTQFRPLICAQYVDIYPTMLELFFLFDREPEYSCMTSLTSQVFTSGSNANMITEHGDLTRLLAAAYGYLTTLSLTRPDDVVVTNSLMPSSFKNRRIGQVFFDICCVLNKTRSFDNVLSDKFINQISDVLSLFQGRPTLVREAVEHVEYESNDYGLYFNMYSVVCTLAEVASRTLSRVDTGDYADLVILTFQRVCQAENMNDVFTRNDSDALPLSKRWVQTIEGAVEVSNFQVHSGTVSFLHPLQAFATWFVQYSKSATYERLDAFIRSSGSIQMHILEYPLRTLVLLAQIRVGFWVRNGFSIRSQQHVYRTTGIRESGFRRDIYMIQLLMSIGDRDLVLTSMLSRWELLPWLNEDLSIDVYDEVTLPLMVEEFLLMMIQFLCETTTMPDPESFATDRIKREIIHMACFQPLSYSKLCAEVPDFLSHEKKFDLILKEVAEYIPPNSPSGTGLYKLKEKYMDDVDPYYLHYSSNKRDEAERLVKQRIANKKSMPFTETFIEPRVSSLENTPFKRLFQITSSKIFVQFLKSTLKYVSQEGVSEAESLLSHTLHLIHVAVAGIDLSYSSTFNENIWSELAADHNEPFYYESVGSLLYKFLTNEECSAHHSKIRAIFRLLKEKNVSVEGYLSEQVQNFDPQLLGVSGSQNTSTESEFERKKRLAKERRAKIMAKFKKQQNKFVEDNKVDEDFTDELMSDDSGSVGWQYPDEHCILCQMAMTSESFFGVVCNVSKFSGSRVVPFEDKYWTLRAFEENGDIDFEGCVEHSDCLPHYFEQVKQEAVVGPAFPGHTSNCLKPSVMTTSCGHGMHYSCYQNYITSAKARQTQITRTVPEDFENAEFVCPLCKSLGNMFVPILWSHNKNKLHDFLEADGDTWYQPLETLKVASFSDASIVSEFVSTITEQCKATLKSAYKSVLFEGELPSQLTEIWAHLSSKVDSVSQPQFRDQVDKLVSSTIKGTEISLRGMENDSGIVASLVTNQSLTTLRILCEMRKTWVASLCSRDLQHTHVDGDNVKFAEEAMGKMLFLCSDRLLEVFEDVDFLDLLVSCTPYGGVSMNTLYRMAFTWFFIQRLALILAQLNDVLFEGNVTLLDLSITSGPEKSYSSLLGLARQLRDNHPLFDNVPDEIFESHEFQETLYTMLVRSLTPFLRNVVIWSLANCADYSDVRFDYADDETLEVNRLCSFLNLPSADEMLMSFSTSGTVENEKFGSFVNHISTTDNELRFKSMDYPGLVRLVDLPDRMDDIFTKLLYKKNRYTSLVHFDPAICLFCGTILNLQRKAPGHEQGECNHHVEMECLNDIGVFLLPKHTAVLLLHQGTGSFHPAPYIDSHGEYDSEVRQTQVLTLSHGKYDQFIRQMWLQHDSKNYITRKLEGTLDIGGWETL